MDNTAAHYLDAFEKAQALPFDSDHIKPFPRHTLTSAYVFSPTYKTDVLRERIEEVVGVIPKLPESIARAPVLYVLEAAVPEGFGKAYRENIMANQNLEYSREKKIEMVEGFLASLPNQHTSAVFMRAATNPHVDDEATKASGNVLLKAFEPMEKEISWRFKEASQHMMTPIMEIRDILRSCDPRLVDREFNR
ncbi:MAG: hypothetical protein HY362_03050 [Candidatus Aenigmarchaeota archaeon]|nr:hypothetical protein [Candidatus Aenigmarchaeota archaeon]